MLRKINGNHPIEKINGNQWKSNFDFRKIGDFSMEIIQFDLRLCFSDGLK